MKLIVVRHGTTENNQTHLITGQLDIGLAKEGLEQANELANELSKYQIEAIYSSPLKRAIQTAEPIADKINLKITEDPRLMEVNYGEFTGRPGTSTIPVFGKDSTELMNSYEFDLQPYGGESNEDLEKRIGSFIKDLKSQDYKTVLIVGHSGTLRWLSYVITGQKIKRQPNASLSFFEL